jgi:hypothetical protein
MSTEAERIAAAKAAQKAQEDNEAALAEVLATVRPLVASEEGRTTALNSRALGVLQALAIVTAVGGFFGKDVVTQGFLDADKKPIRVDMGIWTGKLVTVAGEGLILVLAVLVITTITALQALLPHRRVFFGTDIVADWLGAPASTVTDARNPINTHPGENPPPDTALPALSDIRRRAAWEIGGAYLNLQEFNAAKVKRLKRAYFCLGVAIVLAVALTGFLAYEAAYSVSLVK